MDGDDFGLDPEELGLILGLADEIAEEKKERYRLLREMEADEQRDRDHDLEDEAPPPGYRLYQGRPDTFMQYVEDYCKGRLKAGAATPYGYDYHATSTRMVRTPAPPIFLSGVTIHRSHTVSRRLLTLFQRIFERFPDHHVNAVIFSENGKPRIKGVPVFALYFRRTNTVIFNLARHVDNAARIALDLNPSFSIRGLFWYSMLASLLHELHHSILLQNDRYHGEDARGMVEVEADRWRDQTLRMLAAEIDLEPPPLIEEPFLQEHFNALLQQQERRGNAKWVKHQKLLVDANVLYWDAETHIAYPNMAALCGSQTTEREQGAMDQEAARVYGAQQDRKMAAFTKNEGEKERLLRRAIAMSRKVTVDYVDRFGKSSSGRVLFPFDLTYRTGHWYLEAYCTDRSGKRLFRLDRIKTVSF